MPDSSAAKPTAERLIELLAEVGATVKMIPATGQLDLATAKDPDLKASAQSLLPLCRELKTDLRELLAIRCPLCERDVSDPEDRERLKSINPFCRGIPNCPFRETPE